MSWKEDTKMIEELQNFTGTCKNCGHRVRLTNKYKRDICRNCGKMVYLYEEDEKKNEFRDKLRRMIRNG